MHAAVELSRVALSCNTGGPFGCVIIKDGEVVGSASNKVTENNDPTAHAEVEAIRQACKNLDTYELKGCIMYTSCEPCPMCLGAIYWARLDKVYFANDREDAATAGFDDSFIYKEIEKETGARKITMIKMDNTGAKNVFDEWLLKENKLHY